jgi:DNA polymerase-3 subunit alpha
MLQKIAGYTPGRADVVRKAIGKKNLAIMAAEEPRFLEGCTNMGLDDSESRRLWNLIQPFANYSFNRAHSASYAYVAYQTAWLKAHYPVEYMAALLTSVKDRKDDKPKYLGMARKMRIPVLLPDVNSSDNDFTPTGDSIRFGLAAVRHVGEGVVEKIADARKTKGRFESFYDFCRKVDYTCLNKKTVEALIWAGAFESMGHTRKGLIEVADAICAEVVAQRRQEEAGQFSLFGASAADDDGAHERPIARDEHPRQVLLAQEKEMLGLYVSDHPLLGVEGLLGRMTDASIAAVPERTPGDVVTVGGVVANLTKRVTRRGEVMMTMTLEDLSGATIEVILFPRTIEGYGHLARPDAIVLVKGRVDQDARDDSWKLIALEIHEPRLDDRPFVIGIGTESCTPSVVDELKEVLSNHPGSTQVFLRLAAGARTTVLRLGSEFCVDTGNGLHAELKAHLGQRITLGA